MSYAIAESTITDLVAQRPARSRVFEQVGIKYCCAGAKTLAEACLEKGLDARHVAQLIATADAAPDDAAVDWNARPISELIAHILETHHVYLKHELPRLQTMADKVAKVHGKGNANLLELAQLFEDFTAELNMHMMKEENILFPAILDGGGGPCGSIEHPVRVMEAEHASADRALDRMRELTDTYEAPDWACNTYRALFDGLRELDQDMQQHIHKENNILFPRALAN
jgi:regulator of cell morphogenesis and NO signaling